MKQNEEKGRLDKNWEKKRRKAEARRTIRPETIYLCVVATAGDGDDELYKSNL